MGAEIVGATTDPVVLTCALVRPVTVSEKVSENVSGELVFVAGGVVMLSTVGAELSQMVDPVTPLCEDDTHEAVLRKRLISTPIAIPSKRRDEPPARIRCRRCP